MKLLTSFWFASVVCLSSAACQNKPSPEQRTEGKPSIPAPAAPSPMSAQTLFTARCAVCHGATGKGNGPGGAALKVKPRDYSDPAWQQAVTDDELKAIIVKGGAAVGKDPGMPPHQDLEQSPETLDSLVRLIRDMGKPSGK